jgi:multicomponent Na+:H+ antiporter subunit F
MFHNIVVVLLIVLCLCNLLALLYIITAHQFEDRVLGVNLVGTIVINLIAMLAMYLDSSFLVDVCLVYAFLSFLAVVVLCRLLSVQMVEKGLKDGKRYRRKGGFWK